MIVLACLTPGVGLVSACGVYFSQLLPLSYRAVVILISAFSLGAANLGLAQLIAIAVPVLYTIYPVAIALVGLNLLSRCWRNPRTVFAPVLLVARICGLVDGFKAPVRQRTPRIDGLAGRLRTGSCLGRAQQAAHIPHHPQHNRQRNPLGFKH